MSQCPLFDDLVLRNIFMHLHDASARRAVAYVCRRWRRNCAFVAPLSSLEFWIKQGNERLSNLLFDAIKESCGFVVPLSGSTVSAAIYLGLVSTVKRFSTLNLAPNYSVQQSHFLTVLNHGKPGPATTAMFDILYSHPVFPENWHALLTAALVKNHPQIVKRLLKTGAYNSEPAEYWFTDLFYRHAIICGNVNLCQLYINDRRFRVTMCNVYFCHVCSRGYTPVVRMFLRQRPELDINCKDGTPLMLAVKNTHRKVVLLLLRDPRLIVSKRDELLDNCPSAGIKQALVSYFSQ